MDAERKVCCLNCRYFVLTHCNVGLGDCRRHAPVKADKAGYSQWPAVNAENWCGDYVYSPRKDDADGR